jgi:hypothetical protein
MRSMLPLALMAALSITACSKPATNASATPPSGTTASPAPAAASAPGTVCDRKLITAADVAPLLSEAISEEQTIPGDAQSCEFDTTGFSQVQISVRPGLGNVSVAQTKSGATNQSVTPLAGVGDTAVWDPLLKEVDATKGNVLCVIGAHGPATSGATSDKVGALCNKIFAGLGL